MATLELSTDLNVYLVTYLHKFYTYRIGRGISSIQLKHIALDLFHSKFSLVVMIVYVIGIGWKLVKIYKGEYVKEEPIYLKYK